MSTLRTPCSPGVASDLAGELAVRGVGAPDAAGVGRVLAGPGGRRDQRAGGRPVGAGRVVGRLVVIGGAFFAQAAGGDDVVANADPRLQGAGGAGDQEGSRAEGHELFEGHDGTRAADGNAGYADRVAVQFADAQAGAQGIGFLGGAFGAIDRLGTLQAKTNVGLGGADGLGQWLDHEVDEPADDQRRAVLVGIAAATLGVLADVRFRVDDRRGVAVRVEPVGR